MSTSFASKLLLGLRGTTRTDSDGGGMFPSGQGTEYCDQNKSKHEIHFNIHPYVYEV